MKQWHTFASDMLNKYTRHPFAVAILKWFDENGRSLPWRETTDPYAIWLSEIILQQTRIQQGWAYWERFMLRWPTVEQLAAATEDEVLREWQGLGYYSRARHLHQAARQVVAMGGFPRTFEGLRGLEGVGDYTAAAIGSLAFHLPLAVVDGNVFRVLARHFGIDTPINSTAGKKEFAALAQELLPQQEAAAYNQGLMDFGAMQCVPKSPKCMVCPLQQTCVAWREGRVDMLPVKQKTCRVKERRMNYVYVRHGGCVALRRRGEGDIWQGLWEPFLLGEGVPPCEWVGCRLLLQGVKHVLTHRILMTDFYLWEPDKRPSLPDGYLWIPEEDLDNFALPRLIDILLERTDRAAAGPPPIGKKANSFGQ